MGSQTEHFAATENQHQARLYATAQKLNSLAGQDQIDVARGLFSALVDAMGIQSGRVFLTNEENNPVFCLVLTNGQRIEYDEITSPPLHEQALAGFSYRRRRGILIADTAADQRWTPWAESPESAAAGSALSTPIQTASRPLGAITLIAEQPNHFSEIHLTLITNLADQAAIMIENTRLRTLLTQNQNALNALRQTTRIISTSQNLDQILQAILHQLTRLVPLQYAMILLQKDKHLYPGAVTGFTAGDHFSRRIFSKTEIPAVFHALDQGSEVITAIEERTTDLDALGFPAPIHTWSVTPLIAGKETLGALLLAGSAPLSPNIHYAPTINAFADHVSIAILNHRLSQEMDRRLREMAFLYETGQSISSTLNLDRILHLLLARVRELLQIDAVSIALRDDQTGELVFEAASGEGATDVLGVRLAPGQGIAGWVAETGKPLVIQDAYSDARFFADVDKVTGLTTKAILGIPIVLKGHVVGVIEALNPGLVPFDEQAVDLLNTLAGLAATAIDNARLFARVQSAETRFEGLFEDNVNPIIITDLKGTIIEVNRNACSLFGKPKEDLQGANLTRFRSADDTLDFGAPLGQINSGKEPIFQTTISGQGQRTTVEISGKKILVNAMPLIQWIGRDVSAEVELEQIREDLLRMIIHDLRNPLANIMNSLDVLYDVIKENDDTVSLDDLLNIAKRSGKRMLQLINSILDLSRLEEGNAILETQATELIPLIQEAVQFVTPQTSIRQISLKTYLDPNLPLVQVDSDMISRVVLNLLDNAIKFTQVGGTISLTAQKTDAEIKITVADNGPGIPTDQLKVVFEKFARVHTANGPKGTGLGLAFCQLAIERHNGRIWAESIYGKGATFSFTLPVTQ